jgi:hypothetical protein
MQRPFFLLLCLAACAGQRQEAIEPILVPPPAAEPSAPPPAASAEKAQPPSKPASAPLPPGANGPRDLEAMIGAAGKIAPPPQKNVILVNSQAVRAHRHGVSIGPILRAVPQWNDYVKATQFDPIQDAEWVVLAGPSMTSRDRNLALLYYRGTEADADKAMQQIAKAYAKGGPVDVKVPGVKAVLGYADDAERLFLRPQPHLMAVVPPDMGKSAAETLKPVKIDANVRPGELLRMSLGEPSRTFAILPSAMKSARIWMNTENDGLGVYAEADCESALDATEAAEELTKRFKAKNTMMVRMVIGNVLDHVDIRVDGTTVRFAMPMTGEQLTRLISVMQGMLGVP